MQFNHYGGEAALLAADLINLPVSASREQVERTLCTHRVANPELTATQAAEITGWGHRQLSRCFAVDDIEQQCDAVNELLSIAASKPYISLHDDHPHLHYRSMTDDPVARVRAITVAGLAYMVCFAGGHRLGRCARTGCGIAFVDRSRTGRRRFCCVRCANTCAVARHRRRVKS